MRFMVLVKANRFSEAGILPPKEIFARMTKFNEQLVDAGVLVMAEGLHPSSKGVRVKFSGDMREIIHGPFHETDQLLAGFWIWETKSLDEAVAWLKKAPFDFGMEIELRSIVNSEDFGEHLPPEIREKERELRARMQKQHSNRSH